MWLHTWTYPSLLCLSTWFSNSNHKWKFYKRNCRQQIKTRWGYTNKLKTMITEMSISLDYTPRHLHIVCKKISIENMYVSTGYIIRYHYTEPILCKSPFTMTKFYRLHINMQFIRNICFKIKSYQFLLTMSKLCNLNPYTAPLLALFM